jgi:hypothetical protein
MAAGIADRVWNLGELLSWISAESDLTVGNLLVNNQRELVRHCTICKKLRDFRAWEHIQPGGELLTKGNIVIYSLDQ